MKLFDFGFARITATKPSKIAYVPIAFKQSVN
jgi:hypothetical protein